MYQLGLSPAATAEVPTSMSAVALGANRWASRVVVVLQLAAWSAVGIVLLQKGVSSLQKIPVDVKNVTTTNDTEIITVANIIMEKINISEEYKVENIFHNQQNLNPLKFNKDNSIKNEYHDGNQDQLNDPKYIIPGVIPISNNLITNHLSVNKIKSVWNTDRTIFQNGVNINNNNNNDNNNNNKFHHNEKEDHDQLIEDAEVRESTTTFFFYPSSFSSSSSSSPPSFANINNNINNNNNDDDGEIKTSTEKYDKISETRKKVRMANLSGGGAAAAAVAMVAVGAVMLVLGPVVIILRALDERRQERRFLKLSGQDDLPPSYEQATLMDEAPRYSTLSLNTINCSGSSTVIGEAFEIPAGGINPLNSRIVNNNENGLESINHADTITTTTTTTTAGEIHQV